MTAPPRAGMSPAPLNPLIEGPGEYPFVALERRARELAPAGLPLIGFSIGDPRERTPDFIRETLKAAVPEVSSYPATIGSAALRRAFCGWFRRRFDVALDPEAHALPANGTKEAVFLMPLAVLGRESSRRGVVIPSPAYPVYEPSVRFAGGDPILVPLRAGNGWRFEPDDVPAHVWERTAMVWLNTPHNPTGSMLDLDRMKRLVELARRHGFWVAADEAYADLYFDDRPHSVLECGLDNAIALHTLSKRSAMTGYRSGFLAGDPRLIAALRRMRPNAGVATPEFVQAAAIAAWNDDAHAAAQRDIYRAKRELFLADFARRGWKVEASAATFYLWFPAPGGDDVAFVERLLKLGIIAVPGRFFGEAGAGYVRWALVPTLEQCREAIARMDAAGADLGG